MAMERCPSCRFVLGASQTGFMCMKSGRSFAESGTRTRNFSVHVSRNISSARAPFAAKVHGSTANVLLVETCAGLALVCIWWSRTVEIIWVLISSSIFRCFLALRFCILWPNASFSIGIFAPHVSGNRPKGAKPRLLASEGADNHFN